MIAFLIAFSYIFGLILTLFSTKCEDEDTAYLFLTVGGMLMLCSIGHIILM